MSRRTLRQHHATKPELLPALLNAVQDAGGVDDHRKLEYLIQVRNKDPNQRTAEGETPLMAAALAGAGGMTACLLSHGANPALLCTNGSSALSAAAFACSPRIVKMLLHHGNEETALQHGLERLLQTAHAGLEAHRVSVYGTLPAHDLCNMEDHYKHTMMQHHSRLVVQYLTEWFSEQTASGQVCVARRVCCRGSYAAIEWRTRTCFRPWDVARAKIEQLRLMMAAVRQQAEQACSAFPLSCDAICMLSTTHTHTCPP